MKERILATFLALAALFAFTRDARADVTSVSINDPTTASPVNADAGYTFTAGVGYTANSSGGSTISLTLKLLSGTTVVSQTNVAFAKQVPSGTVNVTYALAGCAPNGTYALAAEATETSTVYTTNSDAVIVTGGQPIAFTVTGGGAYCSGGTGVPVGLSDSEFGVNYQLKRGAVNNGSPIAGTGSAISFGNKVFPATYTVVAVDAVSGCSATMTGSAVVSVNPPSVGGTATATASSVCSGTSTTISLTGQTGNIVEWQYSTDNGDTWNSIASTNNPLTTGALTTSTYFQAVVLNAGCTAAYSSSAGVTVYPATVGGTATPASSPVCSGSGTVITLSGHAGSIVKWQSSVNGVDWTDIASTANPLNTGNLTVTKQFRAVVLSGSCSAENSSVATVVASPATVPGTATATVDTICAGTGTTIQLSGYIGDIVRWESSPDGINWSPIASTSSSLSTGNLTASTQFRAMVQSGGCNLLDSGIASVTVTPVSVGGTATPGSATLCSGSATTITLTGQTGSIVKWQSSLNGTSWTDIPSTANPLNTGNLTVSKHYRAIVLSGSCSATNSSEAIVTVSPPTVPGSAIAAEETICYGASTTIMLSGYTGNIVRWESSQDGINWSPIASTASELETGNLAATTQFRAMVQSGGCNLLDSGIATVAVTPASVGGTATATTATLCNGTSTTITLTGQTGSIVKWQSSLNGTSWTDIPSTANPLNTGNLTATKQFRAVVLSGSCASANSSVATVTVNSAPSITSHPASAVRLVGDSVTFSVNASNATGYQWRTNGVAVASATSSSFTINSITAANAASYDVVVFGESPCTTTISSAAMLTVGSKLVFTSEPVNTTAGTTLPGISVQIQDSGGNNIAVSGAAVSLSLNGDATLGGTATGSTDANGAAAFSDLNITKAGAGYTLTASSGGLTAATSSAFNITAASPSAYRIATASPTLAPGTPSLLNLRLVDPFTNTITTFTGDKNLTFSGLAIANNGSTHPTVTDKTGAAVNLGAVTTVRFTNGLSALGGTLLAYKSEGPVTLSATDGTLSTATPGGSGANLTITNAPALAGADSATRKPNAQIRFTISNLLTNDTDANRDPISFAGVNPVSTQGASLIANASFIVYSMPSGSNPSSDSFQYTITDGSLTSTGLVNITLQPEPTGITYNIVSYTLDGANHPVLTFAGVPGYTYKVQRSQDLATWTDLVTTNIPAGGLFQFTDLNPSNPAFYRAINQ